MSTDIENKTNSISEKCPLDPIGCDFSYCLDNGVESHFLSHIRQHNDCFKSQFFRLEMLEQRLTELEKLSPFNKLRETSNNKVEENNFVPTAPKVKRTYKVRKIKAKRSDPSKLLGRKTGRKPKQTGSAAKSDLSIDKFIGLKNSKLPEIENLPQENEPNIFFKLAKYDDLLKFDDLLTDDSVELEGKIARFNLIESTGSAVGRLVLKKGTFMWNVKVMTGRGPVMLGIVKEEKLKKMMTLEEAKDCGYFLTSDGRIWNGKEYNWFYPDYFPNLEIHFEYTETDDAATFTVHKNGCTEKISTEKGPYRPIVFFYDKKGAVAIKNVFIAQA